MSSSGTDSEQDEAAGDKGVRVLGVELLGEDEGDPSGEDTGYEGDEDEGRAFIVARTAQEVHGGLHQLTEVEALRRRVKQLEKYISEIGLPVPPPT